MTIQLSADLPNPSSLDMAIVNTTQTSKSEFTGAISATEQLGSRWEFAANWGIVDGSQVPLFRSFLSKLRGGAQGFYYSDVSYTGTSGGASGALVIVSSVNIEVVQVQTTTPSTTILKEGDYVEIPTNKGIEYKLVQADVVTDASGLADITILPQLRGVPTPVGFVVYDNPRGIFIAPSNVQRWQVQAPNFSDGLTLNGVELF